MCQKTRVYYHFRTVCSRSEDLVYSSNSYRILTPYKAWNQGENKYVLMLKIFQYSNVYTLGLERMDKKRLRRTECYQ